MPIYLTVMRGPAALLSQRLLMPRDVSTVGSSADADISLPDAPGVAALHARVHLEGRDMIVEAEPGASVTAGGQTGARQRIVLQGTFFLSPDVELRFEYVPSQKAAPKPAATGAIAAPRYPTRAEMPVPKSPTRADMVAPKPPSGPPPRPAAPRMPTRADMPAPKAPTPPPPPQPRAPTRAELPALLRPQAPHPARPSPPLAAKKQEESHETVLPGPTPVVPAEPGEGDGSSWGQTILPADLRSATKKKEEPTTYAPTPAAQLAPARVPPPAPPKPPPPPSAGARSESARQAASDGAYSLVGVGPNQVKRRRRRPIFWILATLGVVACVPLFAALGIWLYVQLGYMTDRVNKSLQGAFGPGAGVREVRLAGLLPLSLVARDLRVPSATDPKEAVLTADTAEVGMLLEELVFEKNLRSLTCVRPSVKMRQDASGKWNLNLPKGEGSGGVLLEHVLVKQGIVEVTAGSPEKPWTFMLEKVDFLLDLPSPLQQAMEIKEFRGSFPSGGKVMGSLRSGPGQAFSASLRADVDPKEEIQIPLPPGVSVEGRIRLAKFEIQQIERGGEDAGRELHFNIRLLLPKVTCDLGWARLDVGPRGVEGAQKYREVEASGILTIGAGERGGWALTNLRVTAPELGLKDQSRPHVPSARFLPDGSLRIAEAEIHLDVDEVRGLFQPKLLGAGWDSEGEVALKLKDIVVPFTPGAPPLKFAGSVQAAGLRLAPQGQSSLPPVDVRVTASGEGQKFRLNVEHLGFGEIGGISLSTGAAFSGEQPFWVQLLANLQDLKLDLDLGRLLDTEYGRRLLCGRLDRKAKAPEKKEVPAVLEGQLAGQGLKVEVGSNAQSTTFALQGIETRDLQVTRWPLPLVEPKFTLSGVWNIQTEVAGTQFQRFSVTGRFSSASEPKLEAQVGLHAAQQGKELALQRVEFPTLKVPMEKLASVLYVRDVKGQGNLLLDGGQLDFSQGALQRGSGTLRFDGLALEIPLGGKFLIDWLGLRDLKGKAQVEADAARNLAKIEGDVDSVTFVLPDENKRERIEKPGAAKFLFSWKSEVPNGLASFFSPQPATLPGSFEISLKRAGGAPADPRTTLLLLTGRVSQPEARQPHLFLIEGQLETTLLGWKNCKYKVLFDATQGVLVSVEITLEQLDLHEFQNAAGVFLSPQGHTRVGDLLGGGAWDFGGLLRDLEFRAAQARMEDLGGPGPAAAGITLKYLKGLCAGVYCEPAGASPPPEARRLNGEFSLKAPLFSVTEDPPAFALDALGSLSFEGEPALLGGRLQFFQTVGKLNRLAFEAKGKFSPGAEWKVQVDGKLALETPALELRLPEGKPDPPTGLASSAFRVLHLPAMRLDLAEGLVSQPGEGLLALEKLKDFSLNLDGLFSLLFTQGALTVPLNGDLASAQGQFKALKLNLVSLKSLHAGLLRPLLSQLGPPYAAWAPLELTGRAELHTGADQVLAWSPQEVRFDGEGAVQKFTFQGGPPPGAHGGLSAKLRGLSIHFQRLPAGGFAGLPWQGQAKGQIVEANVEHSAWGLLVPQAGLEFDVTVGKQLQMAAKLELGAEAALGPRFKLPQPEAGKTTVLQGEIQVGWEPRADGSGLLAVNKLAAALEPLVRFEVGKGELRTPASGPLWEGGGRVSDALLRVSDLRALQERVLRPSFGAAYPELVPLGLTGGAECRIGALQWELKPASTGGAPRADVALTALAVSLEKVIALDLAQARVQTPLSAQALEESEGTAQGLTVKLPDLREFQRRYLQPRLDKFGPDAAALELSGGLAYVDGRLEWGPRRRALRGSVQMDKMALSWRQARDLVVFEGTLPHDFYCGRDLAGQPVRAASGGPDVTTYQLDAQPDFQLKVGGGAVRMTRLNARRLGAPDMRLEAALSFQKISLGKLLQSLKFTDLPVDLTDGFLEAEFPQCALTSRPGPPATWDFEATGKITQPLPVEKAVVSGLHVPGLLDELPDWRIKQFLLKDINFETTSKYFRQLGTTRLILDFRLGDVSSQGPRLENVKSFRVDVDTAERTGDPGSETYKIEYTPWLKSQMLKLSSMANILFMFAKNYDFTQVGFALELKDGVFHGPIPKLSKSADGPKTLLCKGKGTFDPTIELKDASMRFWSDFVNDIHTLGIDPEAAREFMEMSRLKDLQPKLKEWKAAGFIGESREGLLAVLPSGKASGSVEEDLVELENSSRLANYRAILKKNNQPPEKLPLLKEKFGRANRDAAEPEQYVQHPLTGDWVRAESLKLVFEPPKE